MKNQELVLSAGGRGLAVARCLSISSDPGLTSEDQQHSPPTEVWSLPSVRPLWGPLHPCSTDLYHPRKSVSPSVRRPTVTCLTDRTVLRKSVCLCIQFLSTDISHSSYKGQK